MPSQIEEQIKPILIDEWRGLYRESWKGVIVDEAFAHPAKFSRALIQKIYEHVVEEGWANKGDSVVDPFGGVALGAFPAMQHGLVWYGCELEEKFVTLGNQNIALWNERYSRMPNWGTARLLQGDSRKLIEVLSAAECCVSSPPYAGNEKSDYLMSDDGKTRRRDEKRGFRQGHGCFRGSEGAYGQSEGQLGAMREGDLNLAITSPPYANDTVNDRNGIDQSLIKKPGGHNSQSRTMANYGEASGQLGAMREGDHPLVVSSPPYVNSVNAGDHGIDWSKVDPKSTGNRKRGEDSKHGKTLRAHLAYTEDPDPANLGAMVPGEFAAAISSPPFSHPDTRDRSPVNGDKAIASFMNRAYTVDRQGQDENNLAGLPQGDFQAAISSPPYEATDTKPTQLGTDKPSRANGDGAGRNKGDYLYGQSEGQLGTERGETFWSASRLVLEQLHQVIVPGGHAVFVVKAFVRDKKIVDFPAQWAQLCEAVGFRLLHDHHALLTEHYGTQGGFDEDKKLSVERKSFFRRLAESKGSPRIDHENVLCFQRL